MVEMGRIVDWCTAAGHLVATRPGEAALVLDVDGLDGRVELPDGDAPARFAVRVPLDGCALARDYLAAILDGVTRARGPLVALALLAEPPAAEISVTVYPDGLTRHAVLAALDELGKARGALAEALDTATGLRRLQDILGGAAAAPEAAPPPGPAEPPAPAPSPQPAPPPPPAPAPAEAVGPRWCYVDAPVEVRDLAAPDRIAGHLQPGQWYAAHDAGGGWVRVRSTAGDLDGWADAASVRYGPDAS